MEHKIKPCSPPGKPDKCRACVLTKPRAAGAGPFFHSCSSFVSFFFPCSLSLSFLLSLCLRPLPKALKRDENHSTERGEVTNPLALLCRKAGFEQGPWHKRDEFSDHSLILNRARSMLCGYEIYSKGEMESFLEPVFPLG